MINSLMEDLLREQIGMHGLLHMPPFSMASAEDPDKGDHYVRRFDPYEIPVVHGKGREQNIL